MSEGVIIIRPSFMKFCEDGCRAALFNHILYWIGKNAKDQPKEKIQSGEVTYYDTTETLVEKMSGVWGICKVRKAVNDIINLGLIGCCKNPKFGADRTKHFFFGKEQYTKLLTLCKKHLICLAHIGLPKEIINLLAAFSQSVECPCTKQMVNLPNANDKSIKCPPKQTIDSSNANDKSIKCSKLKQTINLSNANDKSIEAITKVTTKDTKTKVSNERMNDVGQQKLKVVEKQTSFHPSIPSEKMDDKISSLSPEEPKEKITLTEEGQRIYDFACPELFKAKRPEITPKLKEECEELATHIKTLEQFQSLLQYVRTKLKAPYHLKNMVNALNEWLQTQKVVEVKTVTTPRETQKQSTNLLEILQRQEARRREEAQIERSAS